MSHMSHETNQNRRSRHSRFTGSLQPCKLTFRYMIMCRMNHGGNNIETILSLICPLRTGEIHLAIYKHPLQDHKRIRIEGTVSRKRSPPDEKWIYLNSPQLLNYWALLPQVIFQCITHKFFYTLRNKGVARIEI